MEKKNLLEPKYIRFMQNNLELFGQYYAKTEDEFPKLTESIKLALRVFTDRLYNILIEEVEVKFVDYEPYDYLNNGANVMFADYKKGFIRVPTTGDDSNIFAEYNLKFRASHDIIHCLVKKNFNYEDEFETFIYTARMFKLWATHLSNEEIDLGIRVLRSEIIYQSAFKNSTAENVIDQKVILSDPV